jgi:hypothetical protein
VSCFAPPQVAKQQAGGSDATAGGARKAADVDPPEPSKPPPDGPDGYIVDPPMVVRTSCADHTLFCVDTGYIMFNIYIVYYVYLCEGVVDVYLMSGKRETHVHTRGRRVELGRSGLHSADTVSTLD